ncbi:phenylacetate--CoA ligase family protein [Nocardia tengchongensis]|uniref:phenylacetate--CoA ligase family protein n=1 Tax=Nocardia tengchongensis TaxID=2055889 RepID=UPI003674A43B
MFTIFRPEFDDYARATIAEQQRMYDGGLSAEELAETQLARIAETVDYVAAHSPFYREHLRGTTFSSARGIEALAELPFTTKDDLRERLFDLPAKPLDKAWVFYETTGTTGRATPCPRDEYDSIVNNVALTLSYRGIFAQHGDRHVVAVLGPTELHSTGDTFGDVLRNLGHTVVKMWPHSPVVGFPRALRLLEELGVTAIVCTPGMAISLAKAAREEGVDLRARLGIRLMFALGELASPAMLERLGELWDASVYNCMYASQEASIMATCHADGHLRTVPLTNYYEVIDPWTGLPAPAVDGLRTGELVVTSLYRGAKPLVRYRTGDMVRMRSEAGSILETLQPIGRVRDTLLLGGRRIVAFDLEQLLFTHIRGVIDYRLVIDTVDGQDRVTLQLDPVDEVAARRLDGPAIRAVVADSFGVRCDIELGPVDAITSTGAMVSWKAARIHDLRVADDLERLAALKIAAGRDAR